MTETASKFFAQLTQSQIGVSEAFLLASSVFLSGSIVAALHHWMDVPVPAAILSVAGCVSVLVAGNVLLRRTSTASAVDEELAALRAEIAVLRSARPTRTASSGSRSATVTSMAAERPTVLLPAPSIVSPAPRSAFDVEAAGDARHVAADTVAPGLDRKPAQQARPASQPTSHLGVSRMEMREDDRPNPATPGAPGSMFGRRSAAPATPASSGLGGAVDLDAMQAQIEELAAHRNNVTAMRREPHHRPVHQAQETEATTAISVAAERTVAPLRKTFANGSADVTARGLQRVAEAASGGEVALLGHVTLISEALEAKRIEVFLDPIVGLGDRKLRYLELTVQLVTQSGHAYAEEELHRIAAGTGLLARIDAAKLANAVGILNRFKANGSRACIFSMVAGESLVDDNFAGAFADILALEPDDDVRLVLVFAQAETRNFSTAHWHAITQIWRHGVTFALAEVTDLDMDFELLKAHGFDFIKLDTAVFLEGLPTPAGHVPAADICRHLAGLGLNLVLGGAVAE